MPMLREYVCNCGHRFEHTFMTRAEEDAQLPACPACNERVTTDHEQMGGCPFHVIVPMHRTSLKMKAGHVHYKGDKPAEKGSVAVPNKGNF